MFKVSTLGLLLVQVSSQGHDNNREVKRILIQDNYYSIMSQLEALTKKVNTLTAENGNLTLEVQRLKANAGTAAHDVAFFAKLTKAVTGRNHYIHYDDVILNIGNAYNQNHGTFVAPVNGTYHFDMYVCSSGGQTVILNLMVNQTSRGSLLCSDSVYVSCRSKAYTVSLRAGDDVYVKSTDQYDSIMDVRSLFGLPSFSGYLIRAH